MEKVQNDLEEFHTNGAFSVLPIWRVTLTNTTFR